MRRQQKSLALALTFGFLLGGSASAAPAVSDEPSDVREAINQQEKPAENAAVENVLPGDAAAKPSSASFHLNALTVEREDGLKVKQAELDKIAASYVGQDVTLNDLNKAASEITRYCRSHGYPAATAYLPEQESADGSIIIKVAPGRYGKVNIDNQSCLSDNVVARLTRGLRQGSVVNGRDLETSLYNIIGMGGVKAGGLLAPGAKEGETDLTVRVEDGKRSTYVLYSNNYGSRAAGRYRYGLMADWYEMSGQGDHLSVNGMVSNASQKAYGFRYEHGIGTTGTKIGIGVSHSNYELGAQLTQWGATGKATTVSVFGTTPLWHKTDEGVSLNYGYDYRDMKDELRTVGYTANKNSHAFHLGVDGFKHSGKTYFTYNVTGYTGRLSGDGDIMGTHFDLGNEGNFSKGTIDASVVQTFNKNWDILLRFSAQRAGGDLDNSEEMYLGGANGVRAYPQGEGAGDHGYLASAELRYHTKVPGLTLSTYFDMGHVMSEDVPALRDATLKGWGIGVTWMRPNNYYARLDYARRIGLPDNHSEDAEASGRLWFMLGKMW